MNELASDGPAVSKNSPQIDSAAALSWLRWIANSPQCVYSVSHAGGDWAAHPVSSKTLNTTLAAVAHKNIYFSPGQIRQAKIGAWKPGKGDISSIEYLWCDIDPSPGRDADDIDLQLMGCPEKSIEGVVHGAVAGVPIPTAIVYSGRGYQCYWRLSAPLAMPEHQQAAEAAMRHLSQSLMGDSSCSETSHVLRLPGSINHGSAKKGPLNSQAFVTYLDEARTYTLQDFGAAAPTRSQAVGRAQYDIDGVTENYHQIENLTAWCDEHGIENLKIRYYIVGGDHDRLPGTSGPVPTEWDYGSHKPANDAAKAYEQSAGTYAREDGSTSAALFAAVAECLRKAVPDEEILSMLMDHRPSFSSHIQKAKDPLYEARRQIARIRAKLEAEQEAAPSSSSVSNEAPSVASNDIQRSSKGVAYWSTHNVTIALELLGASVKHNLLTGSIEVSGLEEYGHGPAWSDLAEDWLTVHLQEKMGFSRTGTCGTLVRLIAHENRYHPIKNYLDGLKWDGVARLDSWLIDLAGVTDDAYTRAVSALPLIAAVRRVRQAGAKFDEMLVLVSEQGCFKSSALEALCPDRNWFGDSLPFGGDPKQTIEATRNKWIVEYADLAGISKKDHDSMKAFLSRTHDAARMAYARNVTEVPRQWIVIGTINGTEFLSDPTGNRRYWPVTVTKPFDLERLKSFRDQLWAEAAHREAAGESIRMDKSLWKEAAKAQQKHEVKNAMQDVLATALGDKSGCIAAVDLWEICGVPVERRKGNAQLKKAMEQLGWTQDDRRTGSHNRITVYKRGDTTEAQNQWLVIACSKSTGKWYVQTENEQHEQPFGPN